MVSTRTLLVPVLLALQGLQGSASPIVAEVAIEPRYSDFDIWAWNGVWTEADYERNKGWQGGHGKGPAKRPDHCKPRTTSSVTATSSITTAEPSLTTTCDDDDLTTTTTEEPSTTTEEPCETDDEEPEEPCETDSTTTTEEPTTTTDSTTTTEEPSTTTTEEPSTTTTEEPSTTTTTEEPSTTTTEEPSTTTTEEPSETESTTTTSETSTSEPAEESTTTSTTTTSTPPNPTGYCKKLEYRLALAALGSRKVKPHASAFCSKVLDLKPTSTTVALTSTTAVTVTTVEEVHAYTTEVITETQYETITEVYTTEVITAAPSVTTVSVVGTVYLKKVHNRDELVERTIDLPEILDPIFKGKAREYVTNVCKCFLGPDPVVPTVTVTVYDPTVTDVSTDIVYSTTTETISTTVVEVSTHIVSQVATTTQDANPPVVTETVKVNYIKKHDTIGCSYPKKRISTQELSNSPSNGNALNSFDGGRQKCAALCLANPTCTAFHIYAASLFSPTVKCALYTEIPDLFKNAECPVWNGPGKGIFFKRYD